MAKVPKRWIEGSNRTLLGFASDQLTSTALAHSLSADELMDRHSLFPILSSFLTGTRAAQYKVGLTSGKFSSLQLPRSVQGLARSQTLRMCPECVANDVKTHGFGHWRRLHQIPCIRFCTHHGLRLQNRCGTCSVHMTTAAETLPGEPCKHCGSTRTDSDLPSERSPGYTALVDLLERALIGEAPELSHSFHSELLSRYFDARDRNNDKVFPMFRVIAWWETSDIFELFQLLQSGASQMNAHALFHSGDTRRCFFLTAAFISYICTHMPELLQPSP
jgi:hypothetical protein